MPFMLAQIESGFERQPYKGLRVLHNTHMTWSTVIKIEALLATGADVTVTVTETLKRNNKVVDLTKAANINFVEERDISGTYDVLLDCCGELCSHVLPTLGAIEQTQTGSHKYQNLVDMGFKIVSIDNTKTKKLETLFGTGDGFVRAFLALTKEAISNKTFCIIGYGKVGHGIIHALKVYKDINIIVIEKNENLFLSGEASGIRLINAKDDLAVRQAINASDVIVTATGIKKLISEHYDSELFRGKILANMGSEDEFGDNFSDKEILFSKSPINFSLKEPTLAMYLDPIFYIHNQAIDILLNSGDTTGLIDIPPKFDLDVLNQWCVYHSIEKQMIAELK